MLQAAETTVERFEAQPRLDELREAERQYGDPTDRIDILDTKISCSTCGTEIVDRFSADMAGDLLCWNCAMADHAGDQETTQTTDPAKVVLGQSGLNHKSLCDYVINVATGCTHGCKFCYVPSTPNITARQEMLKERADVDDAQRDWGVTCCTGTISRNGSLESSTESRNGTGRDGGVVWLCYRAEPIVTRTGARRKSRGVA